MTRAGRARRLLAPARRAKPLLTLGASAAPPWALGSRLPTRAAPPRPTRTLLLLLSARPHPPPLTPPAPFPPPPPPPRQGFNNPKWVDGELLVFGADSAFVQGAQLGFTYDVSRSQR